MLQRRRHSKTGASRNRGNSTKCNRTDTRRSDHSPLISLPQLLQKNRPSRDIRFRKHRKCTSRDRSYSGRGDRSSRHHIPNCSTGICHSNTVTAGNTGNGTRRDRSYSGRGDRSSRYHFPQLLQKNRPSRDSYCRKQLQCRWRLHHLLARQSYLLASAKP
jgi:hypothetical protein